jgi:hypothetical protein
MNCAVEGCERKKHSRGWCGTHYSRWRRNGSIDLTPYVMPPCCVEDCDSLSYSNGMCVKHYQRVRHHGTTELLPVVPFEQRFWSSVAVGDASKCWLWTRPPACNGYGVISRFNHEHYAHRIAYELAHGPIADDLTVDHLCRMRTCVNPNHLELVTRAENTRREMAALANERPPS